jgi:hypothetical protein
VAGKVAGHLMGKEPNSPSVEARVEETKKKLSESLKKLFLLYIHLFYSIFYSSYSFSPSLFLLLFFLLSFTRTYLLLVFGLFWPRGAGAEQRAMPQDAPLLLSFSPQERPIHNGRPSAVKDHRG